MWNLVEKVYTMTNAEMEEFAEIIKEIENGDDQIEPLHYLYIVIKRKIRGKRPDLLKIEEE